MVSKDGVVVGEACTSIKAVDETAAGDAFRAAFAVALAEGLDERTALRHAAAAACVLTAASLELPRFVHVWQSFHARLRSWDADAATAMEAVTPRGVGSSAEGPAAAEGGGSTWPTCVCCFGFYHSRDPRHFDILSM